MKKTIILLVIIAIFFGCSNPNRKNRGADIAAQCIGFAVDVTALVLLGVDTNISGAGDFAAEAGKIAVSSFAGGAADEMAYKALSEDNKQPIDGAQITHGDLDLPDPHPPATEAIAYGPSVVLRNKIEQYSKENVGSEADNDEYFCDLWSYIQADLLEVYKVSYPNKTPDYYDVQLNTYKDRLSQNIELIRKDGTGIPEF